MSAVPQFRRGSAEAEKAAEKAKGGSFARVEYFGIRKEDPSPTKTVRFLTDFDQWPTVAQHASVPTRPAPPGYQGKWPQFMGAVCRNDSNGEHRTFPDAADCYICDFMTDAKGNKYKKTDRTWGLGILRKEVWENGKLVNIVDEMREVTFTKDDGTTETKTEPHYLVFCMAWSNFWSPIDAVAQLKGTCLDRDFRITRKGFEMNDTDYQVAAHDPLYVMLPKRNPDGSPVLDGQGQQVMEQRVLDFRDPDVLAFYDDIPDLGEFIAERASDDLYHRFFDIRFPQPISDKEKENKGGAAANPASGITPPATEPAATPADVAALQARVSGQVAPQPYGTQAAPAQAEAQPATAQVGLPSAGFASS